jgi:hypothetical protein
VRMARTMNSDTLLQLVSERMQLMRRVVRQPGMMEFPLQSSR